MNPLSDLKLIGIFAVLIAMAALVFGYGEHRYDQGVSTERGANLKRDNAALAKANQTILTLQIAARSAERVHAEQQSAISANYQQELKHDKETLDRVVTDLRTGVVRLRIQLARARTAPADSTAPAGTRPGGCDGAESGELSPAAAEFLVGLASEADSVTHQLTACQQVITNDRQHQDEAP